MRLPLVILCFFFCRVLTAQPDNANLSNTAAFAGEPYLAVNPANPKNIVVAWMALDLSTGLRVAIKTKASFDGGQTWAFQNMLPHFGVRWGSADVSMAFRKNGTLYLSYIDYIKPDSGGVYICHSTDGGKSWSAPTRVWEAATEDPAKMPLDRPWLAIDNSGTASDGMLYISTKPAPWIAAPNRPYLKTSADSGLTWSTFRYIDTAGHAVGSLIAAPMAFPLVTADGALCAAFPSFLASQSPLPKYYLAKSYNRGAGFAYTDLLVNPSPVADGNYKLGYRLAANPANAAQMAFVFVDNRSGDPDVFATTTGNGGSTWSAPVRVNDDAQGNGKAQDLVWASYNSDGKLVVTWRDRRNGPGTGFFQPCETFCAVSDNNGVSYKKNILLSNMAAPFDSVLMGDGNDFMACELAGDTIYAAWGDVRSGKLNIYFAKTSVNTGQGTGVWLVNDNEAVQVYPNPASDVLVLSFGNVLQKNITLKINALTGQEVLGRYFDNDGAPQTVDISGIAAGNYTVSLYGDDKLIYNKKLSVIK